MIHSPHGPQLLAGARVAVIGGGPAGSFAALHLLRFARQLNRPIAVTIFERKDFRRRGQSGCNKCAGLLSLRAMRGLEELGLQLPESLVMARLDGYVVHLAGHAIAVTPPDPDRRIVSTYRGGGPLRGDPLPDVSFDAWLLDQARAAGAEVAAADVRSLTAGAQVQIETRDTREPFDMVILASGVNARPPKMDGLAYVPPKTEVMAQDELLLETPTRSPRTQAHVYVGRQPGLVFGALIPKGRFLNVSLLGHRLKGDPVGDFLGRPDCRWVGEQPRRLCGCRPQIAVAAAQQPCADRFVAVGDAATTRLYKDGIGSAFSTARQAAWTALHVGISHQAFAEHYLPLCRSMALDNRIGQLLFWPWQGKRGWLYSLWERCWLRVLLAEQTLPAAQRRGHLALWNMLTGDDSYAHIARHALHPKIFGLVAAALMPELRPQREDRPLDHDLSRQRSRIGRIADSA
jgi:flavin-dependent dehydrogenase